MNAFVMSLLFSIDFTSLHMTLFDAKSAASSGLDLLLLILQISIDQQTVYLTTFTFHYQKPERMSYTYDGEYFCGLDAESLEYHRTAGFHPVHLGDTFKDGRYRVIHKLGHGSFSTVWLARGDM